MSGCTAHRKPFSWVVPLLLVLPLPSCRGESSTAEHLPFEEHLDEGSIGLRPVRVLIAASVERFRVGGGAVASAADSEDAPGNPLTPDEWHIVKVESPTELRVGDRHVQSQELILTAGGKVTVTVSFWNGTEWSPGFEYPGVIRVQINDGGKLDALNLVPVEEYVACVTANEVWPTFETEAYRAQAIIVRTYVLYEMHRQQGAWYDVSDKQGSQVYRGVRLDQPGRRGREAARYTRGVVCTCRDDGRMRLFPTYYSAVCGGCSQSATIFGSVNDVPPLRGGIRCDDCRNAPGDSYRWGPLEMDAGEVLSRLAARFTPFESFDGIAAIEVIERSVQERPTRVRITAPNGATHEMSAEVFRLTVGPTALRSTDCTIRVADGIISFENGRGFGHGLGLCQWGMQGQALQGRKAGQILRYYYPDSQLSRAY